MVYRVYVEKRPGLTAEADALASDIRTLLGDLLPKRGCGCSTATMWRTSRRSSLTTVSGPSCLSPSWTW